MTKWFVAAKKADFNAIAEKYKITPVMARIMRNRELVEDQEIRKFLHGSREDMYAPELLKGMEQAVDILVNKINQQTKIRIMGDYDVDGICSTYILEKGLRFLHANVDAVIPHRIRDGYGLNDSLVEEAHAAQIDTILTCDNGIAAASQIALAKKLNMTIIVTDHHEVPYEETDGVRTYLLPQADAVVDPKQEKDEYPFKQICGGTVAYKLIQALLSKWEAKQEKELDGKQELLEELLGFAAFATVCDVMELKDENRIIVKEGLKLLKQGRNLGIKALMEVTGISDKTLTPYHLGYILGPCLNATGRLDTADRALALFHETSWAEAVTIAADLQNLNESRKDMTKLGVEQAIAQIQKNHYEGDRVLVLYLPECHESLAGIIAGRIREKYHKPTFVLTKGEEEIKGSGRSIEAYSMYEEMTRCKELFTKYGGHKLAAGLSMLEENVTMLRQELNRLCTLTEEDFEERVHIDVPMPMSYVTRQFIEELELLEPFGVGNPKPLFAQKNVVLTQGRILGKNGNVGKYTLQDENGSCFDAIYFGELETLNEFLKQKYGQDKVEMLYSGRMRNKEEIKLSIAYYPSVNSYMGKETIQYVIQNYC